MQSYNDNQIINLSSKNAILNNGSYLSDVQFKFQNLYRETSDTLEAHISITNAQIPISFYNINVYNNLLVLDISGSGIYNLFLTRGNYNANNLITEIQTRFTNAGITDITTTISSITGLLTFTKTTGDFSILSSQSTISKVLGFDPTVSSYISTLGVLSAPYPLNLLGTLKIRILSYDLLTNNIDSSVQGNLNLLSTIPIEAGTYGLILYDNFNNVQSILKNDNLDGFDLKLIDDDGNLINFNGADWSITLLLSITRKRKEKSTTDFKKIVLPLLTEIDTTNQLLQNFVSQNIPQNFQDPKVSYGQDHNVQNIDQTQADQQQPEQEQQYIPTAQDDVVIPEGNSTNFQEQTDDNDLEVLLYNKII